MNIKPPYCAAFDFGEVTVVPCDYKADAAYLCEFDINSTAEVGNATSILFPTASDWSVESMANCPLSHTTHKFLACDAKSNCFAADQEETATCSDHLPRAGPYFTCRDQAERVPYSLVCDFRADCCDNSDEDFCQHPVYKDREHRFANDQVNADL